jgi:hypothetical protein
MLDKLLTYIEVSPFTPGTYFRSQGINSIVLPPPITDKNTHKNIKCFRLCTRMYPETSKIFFVLEPIFTNPINSKVNDYVMSNYFEDIRSIIRNVYGLHDIVFTQEYGMSIFEAKLNSSTREYSLSDVKTLLFIYNNPIRYTNNYLITDSIIPNQTYNYSLLVKSTYFYFHIGLNSSETECIARIWWRGYDVYEGFCYTDLQDELNDRLFNFLPYNTVNITESHPLGFKYYRERGNHVLESRCIIGGNIHMTDYLICILTGKLVYTTESDLMRFLYQQDD